MMTKNLVVGGVAVGLLILGISFYEPPEPKSRPTPTEEPIPSADSGGRPMQQETAMDSEQVARALLAGLRSADAQFRREALDQLQGEYEAWSSSDLSRETRESLGAALREAYGQTEETEEGLAFRRSIVRLMIHKVGGAVARDFAVEVLTSAPEPLKLEVLSALTLPGSMRDEKVYEKALEFARSQVVPDEMKPAILRRVLGKKAGVEMLDLFQSELSPEALKACAVELQNLHDPRLMGAILSRLERDGLLADDKKMPWLSGRLLAEHIRSASHEELARALHVVKARPRLGRITFKAIRERIGDSDPEVRKAVAHAIPDAVGTEVADSVSGEETLVARLQQENDPAVKGVLEDSITRLRTRRPQEATPSETPAAGP